MAEMELWFVDLDRASAALEALERETPRLADTDTARFASMTDAAARSERRCAHVALRILLERRCGPSVRQVPFVVSRSGKPSLPSGQASFSLAHARGCALVALAGAGPLGADIERTRVVRIPEARRKPIEAAAVALACGAPLGGPDADSRFLNAWVRLEAVAKAQGTGVGPMLERLRPNRISAPAALSDAQPGAVAHDVALGQGVFAAIALAPGRRPPEPRMMPETADAITALIGPEATRSEEL